MNILQMLRMTAATAILFAARLIFLQISTRRIFLTSFVTGMWLFIWSCVLGNFFCFREVCGIESFVELCGPEALSSRDEWGYTPAHWAALDGNIEVMRYLIECGAPVDLSCLGTQGPRPIHWACRKGHTAVVQLLLSVCYFLPIFEDYRKCRKKGEEFNKIKKKL